jgi:hypothetical protein
MPASEDEIKIVMERLRLMPKTIKLNIGNRHGAYSRDQLIEEIEQRTDVGEMVVTMYMSYLRSFKEEIK